MEMDAHAIQQFKAQMRFPGTDEDAWKEIQRRRCEPSSEHTGDLAAVPAAQEHPSFQKFDKDDADLRNLNPDELEEEAKQLKDTLEETTKKKDVLEYTDNNNTTLPPSSIFSTSNISPLPSINATGPSSSSSSFSLEDEFDVDESDGQSDAETEFGIPDEEETANVLYNEFTKDMFEDKDVAEEQADEEEAMNQLNDLLTHSQKTVANNMKAMERHTDLPTLSQTTVSNNMKAMEPHTEKADTVKVTQLLSDMPAANSEQLPRSKTLNTPQSTANTSIPSVKKKDPLKQEEEERMKRIDDMLQRIQSNNRRQYIQEQLREEQEAKKKLDRHTFMEHLKSEERAFLETLVKKQQEMKKKQERLLFVQQKREEEQQRMIQQIKQHQQLRKVQREVIAAKKLREKEEVQLNETKKQLAETQHKLVEVTAKAKEEHKAAKEQKRKQEEQEEKTKKKQEEDHKFTQDVKSVLLQFVKLAATPTLEKDKKDKKDGVFITSSLANRIEAFASKNQSKPIH